MKLTDYQNLEQLAAKRGAIMVDAADLLAWREEMAALREWGRRAYLTIQMFEDNTDNPCYDILDDAPEGAKP